MNDVHVGMSVNPKIVTTDRKEKVGKNIIFKVKYN